MEAYRAALDGDKAMRVEIGAANTVPGTVNALIVAYYKSTEFTQDLGEGTKKARRSIIERFRNEHGEKRVAKIERDHIVAMMAAIAKRHAKRNWFKTIRGLMKFAVSISMRKDDPTDGIKNAKVPKSAGHHTWTDEEIKQYRDHWPIGTQQRLAMELALETTSRRADVTRIGRQHIRNGKLDLRHTKNNSEALIPITDELRAAIDACPTKHLTFLHTKAGAPRSAKALGATSVCDAMRRAFRSGVRSTAYARAARDA